MFASRTSVMSSPKWLNIEYKVVKEHNNALINRDPEDC